MKDMDLMKAMNELDDNILREAEAFEIKRRHKLLPKIAAVAAAVALLCGTAYAVANSVRIGYTGKTETLRQEEGVDITYTETEIVYNLGWHEVPDESLEVLQQLLDEHLLWCRDNATWSYQGNSFATYYYQEEYAEEVEEGWHDPGPGNFTFHSFEEAEEFLGLSLDLPPVLREAPLSDKGICLRVLSDPIGEDESEAGVPDSVTPGCVELMFYTENPTDDLWVMNGNIIIPLTETFAAEPYTKNISFALDLKGETQMEAFTLGQMEGQLRYFRPVEGSEYDDIRNGSADAYYTCNGIGYAIYTCPSDNCESDDPKEVLLSYLEQIG